MSEIAIDATRGPDSTGGGVGNPAAGLGGKRAERPLPKALRCLSGTVLTSQDLLCQLNIGLRTTGSHVVYDDRFAIAGCFRQTNAARNNSFEHRFFKETAQIQLDLAGQVGSVVIHGE